MNLNKTKAAIAIQERIKQSNKAKQFQNLIFVTPNYYTAEPYKMPML